MQASLLASCAQMIGEALPNFLRLYLNPQVTQACYCLNQYARTTWNAAENYQSFLANSREEALSGAIKLARYDRRVAGRATAGLIVDPGERLGPFVAAAVNGERVEFVPGLTVVVNLEEAGRGPFGFVILLACGNPGRGFCPDQLGLLRQHDALVITCVDRASLAALRGQHGNPLQRFTPDVVVFDESFVNHEVPFSALTARKSLYEHWNRPGKTTFHSTTFQPNTLASLHFVKCLEKADPEFHATHAAELQRVLIDQEYRGQLFRDLYSPSLYRMTRAAGFDVAQVHAHGDFVSVGGRAIFDAVSGVACSIRGHNPGSYLDQMARLDGHDCEAAVREKLRALTGLEHVLPAVSGAGAVECALRIALAAQHPRRHLLALKAGFGGKTLLALTGTANPAYKHNIDPLYDAVSYVDPFAPDAESQIEAVLEKQPVAVVQVELIQAVGGVRRVPEGVVRFLEGRRAQAGYLLLIDEVQTGMYRTGPFTLSTALGLTPDLLLLGKGTSDMMFPFSLVLFADAVQQKLDAVCSDLPGTFRARHGYAAGYRTVCNVLEQTNELELDKRVSAAGTLFQELLTEGLAGCKSVHEVRVHGLLIGIELDAHAWPQRLFRKRLHALYLYGMLRHPGYPVLAGFCQYEPNVLKITPALTVEAEEIRRVCATIIEVLHQPFHRLLGTAFGGLFRSLRIRRKKHERHRDPAAGLAAR
jgi:acetylornithine/succinyldiaminopimelate/putrescine aminotransferase